MTQPLPLPPPIPPQPLVLNYASPMPAMQIRQVARAQRQIMRVILIAILAMVMMPAMAYSTAGLPVPEALALLVVGGAMLAVVAMMMISVYNLTAALQMGMTSRVLILIGMITPYINILLLLIINQMATKLLRRNSIRVGLMGAKLSDWPVA